MCGKSFSFCQRFLSVNHKYYVEQENIMKNLNSNLTYNRKTLGIEVAQQILLLLLLCHTHALNKYIHQLIWRSTSGSNAIYCEGDLIFKYNFFFSLSLFSSFPSYPKCCDSQFPRIFPSSRRVVTAILNVTSHFYISLL